MQATATLMEEHRIIERVLASLETAAGRLKSGEPVNPSVFIKAVDFIKGFTDDCHHNREENILFPAMLAAGMPAQGGPINVMLAEHEHGRQLTKDLLAAAENLKAGEASAGEAVAANALQYAALMRGHINKENNILFQMADRLIQGEARTEADAAFQQTRQEEINAGLHQRFLAVVADIEKEVSQTA